MTVYPQEAENALGNKTARECLVKPDQELFVRARELRFQLNAEATFLSVPYLAGFTREEKKRWEDKTKAKGGLYTADFMIDVPPEMKEETIWDNARMIAGRARTYMSMTAEESVKLSEEEFENVETFLNDCTGIAYSLGSLRALGSFAACFNSFYDVTEEERLEGNVPQRPHIRETILNEADRLGLGENSGFVQNFFGKFDQLTLGFHPDVMYDIARTNLLSPEEKALFDAACAAWAHRPEAMNHKIRMMEEMNRTAQELGLSYSDICRINYLEDFYGAFKRFPELVAARQNDFEAAVKEATGRELNELVEENGGRPVNYTTLFQERLKRCMEAGMKERKTAEANDVMADLNASFLAPVLEMFPELKADYDTNRIGFIMPSMTTEYWRPWTFYWRTWTADGADSIGGAIVNPFADPERAASTVQHEMGHALELHYAKETEGNFFNSPDEVMELLAVLMEKSQDPRFFKQPPLNAVANTGRFPAWGVISSFLWQKTDEAVAEARAAGRDRLSDEEVDSIRLAADELGRECYESMYRGRIMDETRSAAYHNSSFLKGDGSVYVYERDEGYLPPQPKSTPDKEQEELYPNKATSLDKAVALLQSRFGKAYLFSPECCRIISRVTEKAARELMLPDEIPAYIKSLLDEIPEERQKTP